MRFLISRRETDSLSGYCHLESNSCTQYFVRSSHLTARGLILSTDQNPSCRCAFSMLNMQIGHCRLIVRIVSVGCEEVWPAAPEHSMVAYNRLGALAKFGSWRTSTMMSRLSFSPLYCPHRSSPILKRWNNGSMAVFADLRYRPCAQLQHWPSVVSTPSSPGPPIHEPSPEHVRGTHHKTVQSMDPAAMSMTGVHHHQ